MVLLWYNNYHFPEHFSARTGGECDDSGVPIVISQIKTIIHGCSNCAKFGMASKNLMFLISNFKDKVGLSQIVLQVNVSLFNSVLEHASRFYLYSPRCLNCCVSLYMSPLCGHTVTGAICVLSPPQHIRHLPRALCALFQFVKMMTFDRTRAPHLVTVRTNECLFSDKRPLPP